jgi:creatinine amidohydrolase
MNPSEQQHLSKMEWPEFGQHVETGRIDRAIIPLGSLEQHGPHLPMSTDTIIAEHLSNRIAERCKTAIVLPPVEFGCASEHTGFPGTISLRPETLSNILLETADSLMKSRLKRVFMINGHGGNRATVEVTLAKMKESFPEMQAYSFTVIDVVKPKYNEIRKSDRKLVGHADEIETSMMLAIEPKLVDMSKAVRGEPSLPTPLSFESEDMAKISFSWNAKELSKSGVIGDPQLASVESGRILLEYATEVISTIINRL